MAGAVVGKIILMVFINGFITTLIIFKGTLKEKWKAATKHYKDALLDTIPYFGNLKDFDFKKTGTRWLNITGIGFGFVSYAFITGNGEFINSFVCLVVFFAIVKETVEKRGLITAIMNITLSRFGKKRISRKPVDAVVNGYGIGMLLSILYAWFFADLLIAYVIGGVLLVLGSTVFWLKRTAIRKEMTTCEEA